MKGLLLERECELKWGKTPAHYPLLAEQSSDDLVDALQKPANFRFRRMLLLQSPSPAPKALSQDRLLNLGYTAGEFETKWEQFQTEYQADVRAFPDDDVTVELKKVHEKGLEPPVQDDDGLSEPEPEEFEDDGFLENPLLIELLDEKGEPVAGERFEVHDAEGRIVMEGELDESGRAMVSGVSGDDAVVTFPQFHEDFWEGAANG